MDQIFIQVSQEQAQVSPSRPMTTWIQAVGLKLQQAMQWGEAGGVIACDVDRLMPSRANQSERHWMEGWCHNRGQYDHHWAHPNQHNSHQRKTLHWVPTGGSNGLWEIREQWAFYAFGHSSKHQKILMTIEPMSTKQWYHCPHRLTWKLMKGCSSPKTQSMM